MEKSGTSFPQDPFDQLKLVVKAVCLSHSAPNVRLYWERTRQTPGVPCISIWPTVAGNAPLGLSAVVCTRNAATGAKEVSGFYRKQAMPGDLIRGAAPLDLEAFRGVVEVAKLGEKLLRTPLQLVFASAHHRPILVGATAARLPVCAKLKSLTGLVDEGTVTKEEVLEIITLADVEELLSVKFGSCDSPSVARGTPAGHTTVTGPLVLSKAKLDSVQGGVYVTGTLDGSDFDAILKSGAVVTASGNNCAFVAAVANGFRRAAAIGVEGLVIGEDSISFAGAEVKEGQPLTVSEDGEIFVADIAERLPAKVDDENGLQVLAWADEARSGIKIFAAATSEQEASQGQGVGPDGLFVTGKIDGLEGEVWVDPRVDTTPAFNAAAVDDVLGLLEGTDFLDEGAVEALLARCDELKAVDAEEHGYTDVEVTCGQVLASHPASRDDVGDNAGSVLRTPRSCLKIAELVDVSGAIHLDLEGLAGIASGKPGAYQVDDTVLAFVKAATDVAAANRTGVQISRFDAGYGDPSVIRRWLDFGVNALVCRSIDVPGAKLTCAKYRLGFSD